MKARLPYLLLLMIFSLPIVAGSENTSTALNIGLGYGGVGGLNATFDIDQSIVKINTDSCGLTLGGGILYGCGNAPSDWSDEENDLNDNFIIPPDGTLFGWYGSLGLRLNKHCTLKYMIGGATYTDPLAATCTDYYGLEYNECYDTTLQGFGIVYDHFFMYKDNVRGVTLGASVNF